MIFVDKLADRKLGQANRKRETVCTRGKTTVGVYSMQCHEDGICDIYKHQVIHFTLSTAIAAEETAKSSPGRFFAGDFSTLSLTVDQSSRVFVGNPDILKTKLRISDKQ